MVEILFARKDEVDSSDAALSARVTTVESTLLTAQIITSAAHAGLGAERLLTDSANISWSFATPAQAIADLTTTGVTPSTYGSASAVGQFTVDNRGRITSASGVAISITASQINNPAALTKVDDTNVTLTLGGTPGTALLQAASITAGWTGTLAVARGGLGVGTITGLMQGNGTSAVTGIANSSTVGQVLRVTGASTYAWGALDLASANAITNRLPFTNLTQIAGLSVLGVTGNVTADVAAITAASDGQVMRRSGTNIAFGALDLASVNSITGDLPLANLAQGIARSVLGVTGNATADYAAIQSSAAAQVLNSTATSVVWTASPQITTIELGDAADTTLARSAAGTMTVEGKQVLVNSQTATISKGFTLTPNNLGTMANFTVDPTLGNYQFGTNNAAFTLTAPASDCAVDILVTNGAAAGAITFSGFTAPAGGGGDTYAATNTFKFMLMIRRINAISTYLWKALQ